MSRIITAVFIAFLFSLFGIDPASAQSTAAQVLPGMLTNVGCPPGYTYCYVPYSLTNPLAVTPVSPSGGTTVAPQPLTAVAGTQVGLAIAAATAPTIPTGATYILAQAQGANNTSGVCLYWRDDGTNPTNAAGQVLSALQPMLRKVTADGIKFIAASGATCTVTLSYYKDTP